MSAIDLHPEELIDRAVTGKLTEAERKRLEEHLAVCETCRFERLVREDFRGLLEAEVGLGKQEQQLATEGAGVESRGRSKKSMLRGVRLTVPLAAALSLVAAVAGASWMRLVLRGEGQEPAVELAASGRLPDQEERVGGRDCAGRDAELAVVDAGAGVSGQDADVNEVPTSSEIVVRAKHAPVVTSGPLDGGELEHRFEPVVDVRGLFSEANAARKRGETAVAHRLYAELQSRFPDSSEARSSRAIVAQMHLDEGNPKAALEQYESYQVSKGPLSEEALLGRAVSLQRMGNNPGEAQAWRELIARFPRSVYVPRAKARLAELPAQ